MIPNTENSLTKYKSTKYFHTCVSIVCIYVNTVVVCKSVFKNKTQVRTSLLFGSVKKGLTAHTKVSNLQILRFCLKCHSFNKISTNTPH